MKLDWSYQARLPRGGLGSFRTRLEWGPAEQRVSPWIATDYASLFAAETAWWRDGMNAYTVKISLLAFGQVSAVVNGRAGLGVRQVLGVRGSGGEARLRLCQQAQRMR